MAEVAEDRSREADVRLTPAVRPGWLKSRMTSAVKKRTPPLPKVPELVIPVIHESKAPFVPPETIGGWVQLGWRTAVEWWTARHFGWGISTSIVLHVLILLSLGLTYFSASRPTQGGLVGGMLGPVGPGEDLEGGGDTKLESNIGEAESSLFIPSQELTDSGAMMSAESLVGGSIGSGSGGDGEGEAGGGGGDGSSMARNIRVPESAVTQGSFTVWTDPEDPAPRVAYKIIIQVKLPRTVKQYRLSDLSGMVTGTDQYKKPIKYGTKDRKGVKDGVVQIDIPIPGAAELVKDVIEIRSKLLNEEQRIEIVF